MSMHLWICAATVGVAALPVSAAANVFKCTAADGTVTYQQTPCPETSATRVMDVAAQYPGFDPAERERLFEREAALDKRLEAERNRLSAERIAILSRPEPVFVVNEPVHVLMGPARFAPRPALRRSEHRAPIYR